VSNPAIPSTALVPAPHRGYRIEETHQGDPGRAGIERFVAERFAAVHGASVRRFMPALLGLQDWRGTLRCALGYRPAAAEALFLEQYLDQPVEQAIRRACGGTLPAPVERERIVEVGHLAGRGCRAALHLVAQLPRHLVDRGYDWITFTATARVRDVLATFDAPLVDLGPADPARLRLRDDDWGRYYETQPRVMAGWLPYGLRLDR
jgi:hypothetical protein